MRHLFVSVVRRNFVPQSARECRNWQPELLELPKGEQERQEKLRPYFDQPSRPVIDICADPQLQRLVLLGDPGSGKSSLLRLPLLIELRDYHDKRRKGECGDSFLSSHAHITASARTPLTRS